MHAVVELQALRAPHEVLSGVVGVGVHGQSHRVELVAEEGEVLPVCDHGLGRERPGDVLAVPETWGCLSDATTHRGVSLVIKMRGAPPPGVWSVRSILTLVHGLGSRPGEEAAESVGSEEDLDLVRLLQPGHAVSVVLVRDKVELGVAVTCGVR